MVKGERDGEGGEEEGGGKETKGRDGAGRGKGDRGNGRDVTVHGIGREGRQRGKEEGEGKGGEGLQPPNCNSWRRHC